MQFLPIPKHKKYSLLAGRWTDPWTEEYPSPLRTPVVSALWPQSERWRPVNPSMCYVIIGLLAEVTLQWGVVFVWAWAIHGWLHNGYRHLASRKTAQTCPGRFSPRVHIPHTLRLQQSCVRLTLRHHLNVHIFNTFPWNYRQHMGDLLYKLLWANKLSSNLVPYNFCELIDCQSKWVSLIRE